MYLNERGEVNEYWNNKGERLIEQLYNEKYTGAVDSKVVEW